MKNVLLLAHDDPGQEARLQVALDLVRAVNGHLICLDVTAIPAAIDDYETFGGGALLLADEQAREESNASRLRARLDHEDVMFEIRSLSGNIAECVRQSATLADIVVLSDGKSNSDFPHPLSLAAELVCSLDRPVLVVPENVRALDLFGNALVCWDGSRNAEAALRAATPLLARARQVTLLYADDGSIGTPIEEAAVYLSRHDIEPVVLREATQTDRPGTLLLAAAMAHSVDYVVMGAFSRWRSMEAAFGGATDTMLRQCPCPLFIAHHG